MCLLVCPPCKNNKYRSTACYVLRHVLLRHGWISVVDSHRTRRRRDDNLETLGKRKFHSIFCYALQAPFKKHDFKAIHFPLESIYKTYKNIYKTYKHLCKPIKTYRFCYVLLCFAMVCYVLQICPHLRPPSPV